MIYTEKPVGFTASIAKAVCCVKVGEKILLLLNPTSYDWVLPGRFVGNIETDGEALAKALFEATGWRIGPAEFVFKKIAFCAPRFGPINYECHIFLLSMKDEWEIKNATHLWISFEDAKRSLGINYPRENYYTRRFIELALEQTI